ncbi:hypothetical protein [Blastococcus brunescens]|uniref:Secreted protein n=1 Tax=Blastococcus brunescens TaxID=1564165 RepID=A0ABZ1B1U3_9ACTN|nr:hypothetical protein [Blastococcus sp. BMG 8361]WRL63728.1 hypothetical protein U6N30_29445 [Blastococcus sp. BMG 8361]
MSKTTIFSGFLGTSAVVSSSWGSSSSAATFRSQVKLTVAASVAEAVSASTSAPPHADSARTAERGGPGP